MAKKIILAAPGNRLFRFVLILNGREQKESGALRRCSQTLRQQGSILAEAQHPSEHSGWCSSWEMAASLPLMLVSGQLQPSYKVWSQHKSHITNISSQEKGASAIAGDGHLKGEWNLPSGCWSYQDVIKYIPGQGAGHKKCSCSCVYMSPKTSVEMEAHTFL